jgi:hypothetical protein
MVVKPEARDPEGAASGPVRLVFGFVGVVGLALSIGTGFLIVRGPFLGGPVLPPESLMVTLGGFLAGVLAFSWGGSKALGVGSRL